jgi:hypothetical protein
VQARVEPQPLPPAVRFRRFACGVLVTVIVACSGCSRPTDTGVKLETQPTDTLPGDTVPTGALPTVLVSNGTCVGGVCRTLEVHAFVWAFPVPQLPPGLELVGEVHSTSACLTFPAIWVLHVYGDRSGGGVDTVTYTWTPENTAGIMIFAVDSALFASGGTLAQRDSSTGGLWPYDGASMASVGSTETFVPGVAAGWRVTFPTKLQSGLAAPSLTATAACTP